MDTYIIGVGVFVFLLVVLSAWHFMSSKSLRTVITSRPKLYKSWAVEDALHKAGKINGIYKITNIQTSRTVHGYVCTVLVYYRDENIFKNASFVPHSSVNDVTAA